MRGQKVAVRARLPRVLAAAGRLPRLAAATLAALLLVVGSGLLAGPARAATDTAQLTLTGLSDSANPAGGSQIGIHPGDYVKLGASAAPTSTAKDLANKLGLGSLLSSLLGSVDFQVKADFSRLPGGAKDTVLKEGASKTFHFTGLGTYYFTWQAEKITTGLLGQKTITVVSFDGNQAKKLGIELNATNTYVGAIVVAKNPPKGGISVQLPSVGAHPKVGHVQLPSAGVPGVRLPTVHVPDPGLPTGKSTSTSKAPSKSPSSSTSSSSPSTAPIRDQALPVPARVLARVGGGSGSSGGGGGGYYADDAAGNAAVRNGSSSSQGGSGSSGSDDAAAPNSAAGADRLAKDGPASSQLPVVLAIITVVVLAVAGALYARLWLMRRQTTGS